jgi:hypothetical protein
MGADGGVGDLTLGLSTRSDVPSEVRTAAAAKVSSPYGSLEKTKYAFSSPLV